MPAQLQAFARSAAVLAILLCGTPAFAQPEEAPASAGPPSTLQTLLWTQAILHAADMITTAYDLRLGGNAREGNPLLLPFSQNPVALAAISSGVDVLEMYTIIKLHRRHPKLAVAWAAILVGTETYVVANNIKVAGQLQGAHAGTP
jgi:hypothetical protein